MVITLIGTNIGFIILSFVSTVVEVIFQSILSKFIFYWLFKVVTITYYDGY